MAEPRATCRIEEQIPDTFRTAAGSGARSEGSPSPVSNSGTQAATDAAGAQTPSRKNRRKMSSPRKRADFSIKRFCGESADSVSDAEDDRPPLPLRETPPETPVSTPSGSDQGDSEHSRELPPVAATAEKPVLGREGVYPLNIPSVYLSHAGLSAPMLAAAAAGHHHHHPQHLLPPHPGSSGRAVRAGGAIPPRPPSPSVTPTTTCPSPSSTGSGHNGGASISSSVSNRRLRKNYKNMTRDRRVEANARERTRVHTISAAFESLRRAVPSYSYNQRLSKLAILRIASSYILALSRLADMDYSQDKSQPEFAECVDLCTRTIQAEGKAKRRH